MMQVQALAGDHNRQGFDCGRQELNDWLQQVARLIETKLGPAQKVARLGGDAFGVLLTDGEGNPGGADVLVLADGAWTDAPDGFAIVCVIFDGNDDAALVAARENWRRARDAGHALTYWQEGERGGWEKKA